MKSDVPAAVRACVALLAESYFFAFQAEGRKEGFRFFPLLEILLGFLESFLNFLQKHLTLAKGFLLFGGQC